MTKKGHNDHFSPRNHPFPSRPIRIVQISEIISEIISDKIFLINDKKSVTDKQTNKQTYRVISTISIVRLGGRPAKFAGARGTRGKLKNNISVIGIPVKFAGNFAREKKSPSKEAC